jgi:tetratricopeptide (TPR) repeat protein
MSLLASTLNHRLEQANSACPQEGPPFGRRASTLFMLGLITIGTVVPFIPSLRYGFVYDDDVQVLDAVAARNWQSHYTYFVSSVWNPRGSVPLNYNYYRPLFYFWLRINAALFGYHAFWWHLAAVGLHLAATILVFYLLRRHFADPWIATVGALIFGVHPAHVESVVWVSGVTDPLAAIGFLGSLLLWLKATDAPRKRLVMSPATHVNHRSSGLTAASLLCFAAALAAKETAIVFPVVVFLYALADLVSIADSSSAGAADLLQRLRFAVRESLPYAGLTGLYVIRRWAALHSFSSGSSWISARNVLLTAPSILLFYVRHLVWPIRLQLFYDFHLVNSASEPSFWLTLVLLVVLAGAGFLLWRRIRWPGIPAAALWICLPLTPVLDIAVFQPDDFLHDRYLYFPVIGLAMAAGFLTQRVWGTGDIPRRRLLAFVTPFIVGLAGATAVQSTPWRDNLTLYTAASEHSSNTMARNNLASELAARGRLEEARTILQSVIQQRPDFWLANYNLGYVQYRLRNLADAETHLCRALALNPADPDTHIYLGLTFLRQDRLANAEAELRQAIALKPSGEGYHLGLGMVELRQGHREQAQAEFSAELKYHPNNEVVRTQVEALEKYNPGAASGATSPASAAEEISSAAKP